MLRSVEQRLAPCLQRYAALYAVIVERKETWLERVLEKHVPSNEQHVI
jgi:hypothetical protein